MTPGQSLYVFLGMLHNINSDTCQQTRDIGTTPVLRWANVAQSLKRYGHFSNLGVEIALSHDNVEKRWFFSGKNCEPQSMFECNRQWPRDQVLRPHQCYEQGHSFFWRDHKKGIRIRNVLLDQNIYLFIQFYYCYGWSGRPFLRSANDR